MKRRLRFLVVACAVGAVALAGEPGAAQVLDLEPSVSRTVPLSPTGSFTLSNPSGNVSIKGMGDEVRIEAVKRVNGNDPPDTRRRLDAIAIEITGTKDAVVVRTTIPAQPGEPDAVDYSITVPATATLTVRALGGDIQIDNISGAVDASTVRGDLTLSGLGNLRSVAAIVGDLEIRDSRGDNVTADTLSGTVNVGGLIAASVDLNVGEGNIACSDLRANRVYLRTERGDIQFVGPLERGGLYQLHSSAGSVRLTPQGDVGFNLDASSFRGEIRSNYDFPPAARTSASGSPFQTLQGSVGNASASVTLRSSRGDVQLDRP